jgi:hypothetical protein
MLAISIACWAKSCLNPCLCRWCVQSAIQMRPYVYGNHNFGSATLQTSNATKRHHQLQTLFHLSQATYCRSRKACMKCRLFWACMLLPCKCSSSTATVQQYSAQEAALLCSFAHTTAACQQTFLQHICSLEGTSCLVSSNRART